jgi:hypothetical protein
MLHLLLFLTILGGVFSTPFSHADTRRYAAVSAPAGGITVTAVRKDLSTDSTDIRTAYSVPSFATQCTSDPCALIVTMHTRGSAEPVSCTVGGAAIDDVEVQALQGNARLFLKAENLAGGAQTVNVSCTLTTARQGCLVVRTFSGTNAATPFGATDTDSGNARTAVSLSVASAVNAMVVDGMSRPNDPAELPTPDALQVVDNNDAITGASNQFVCATSHKLATGTPSLMGWTWPTAEQAAAAALVLSP